MKTIIMVYKLNDGVKIEDYKKYSLEVDQPLIKSFDSVKEFNVFFIEGSEKIWDVFEIIKVDSYEDWEKIGELDEVKKYGEIWKKFVNEKSVKSVYGEII